MECISVVMGCNALGWDVLPKLGWDALPKLGWDVLPKLGWDVLLKLGWDALSLGCGKRLLGTHSRDARGMF